MSEDWLPELAERAGPIYRRIVAAISDDLARQRLRPGMRMPTHRQLADRLGINVGTVTRAYARAREMGLLAGEIGRGTFLSAPAPAPAVAAGPEAGAAALAVIDLMINRPPVLEDGAFLRRTLADLAAGRSLAEFLSYPPSNGHERHRLAGTRLAALTGVRAGVDQVVLANGAQQALLAAVSSCTEPGDLLATEALNYAGIRRLADLLRLRIAPVALDGEGMLPDSLEAVCRTGKVAVLVVTPSIHNPTTATLGLERRREIARIAGRHGVPIVENDVYGPLVEGPAPTLFALAETPAWYVCGLSKTVTPGIRVGYAIASSERLGPALAAIHASTWTVAPLMLEIASQWVFEGTVARMIAGHRRAAAERLRLAGEVLAGLPFQSHPQSYHVWLPLPARWPARDFVEACLKGGVAVTPGAIFQTGPGPAPNAVRLSLGGEPDLATLRTGLLRLAQTLAATPAPPEMII